MQIFHASGAVSRGAVSARPVVLAGLFTALTVLFTYVFALQTPFVRFSFGFLPLALYGAMAGPWRAAGVAAAADLLGVFLFGGGNFFPGFTLSAALEGLCYGALFHGNRLTLRRITVTFLLVGLVIHLALNTLWLVLLYEKAAPMLLAVRLPKLLICFPVRIALFSFLVPPFVRMLARR